MIVGFWMQRYDTLKFMKYTSFFLLIGNIGLPCCDFQKAWLNRSVQNSGFASNEVFNRCGRLADAK